MYQGAVYVLNFLLEKSSLNYVAEIWNLSNCKNNELHSIFLLRILLESAEVYYI